MTITAKPTKERPILFSGSMVRAILDGRKTQTRRMVKPQPEPIPDDVRCRLDKTGFWWASNAAKSMVEVSEMGGWCCPYGTAGDRLWVRETFAIETPGETFETEPHKPLGPVRRHVPKDFHGSAWFECPRYRASEPDTLLIIRDDVESDEDAMRWTPSIHMPRWASRITLEITGVRVERLQDISEDDAKAEGAPWLLAPCSDEPQLEAIRLHGHRVGFCRLWQSINGPESWEQNPWVWVVEFKKL